MGFWAKSRLIFNCFRAHAKASIRQTLIGSRALVAYDDVNGSSTANNRPWSRQCTARLFEGLTPVHVPILSE